MINLLSTSAKKKLWNQYLLRLGAVLFLAVAFLEVFAAAIFVPAFYSVYLTTSSISGEIERMKASSPEENKLTIEAIKEVRKDLDLLKKGDYSTNTMPTALLTSIIGVKPRGITINTFSYASANETATIQLSGVAASREDILIFKNELGKNQNFEKPKSGEYIIKKTDIPFSITLNTIK